MELKEIKKSENPLFGRKEVELLAESALTPKMSEVEKDISEKYAVPAENVKVRKIAGNFGSREFVITANVYASKEDREKTETKKKDKKGAVKAPEEKK